MSPHLTSQLGSSDGSLFRPPCTGPRLGLERPHTPGEAFAVGSSLIESSNLRDRKERCNDERIQTVTSLRNHSSCSFSVVSRQRLWEQHHLSAAGSYQTVDPRSVFRLSASVSCNLPGLECDAFLQWVASRQKFELTSAFRFGRCVDFTDRTVSRRASASSGDATDRIQTIVLYGEFGDSCCFVQTQMEREI